MPPTPVSMLVTFVASHLVFLTLVGFLVTGLHLAGVLGLPVAAPAGSSVSQERPKVPEPAAERPGAGPVAQPERPPAADAQVTGDLAAGEGTGLRPTPRLIGGSLPIHGAPTSQPQSPPGPPPAPGGSDFRPPSLTPAQAPPLEPSRDDLVQQARKAFWNGDFEASEAAYMMVLLRYPGDADAFGELGNLYQAMGKPEQALDAYYEAAVRLKAAGNTEKLRKIITMLDEKGDTRGASLLP